MENQAFVDGELESLLRMFNFDRCSSDESSFYNDQYHLPNEIDAFFPFGTILDETYTAVLEGSSHQTNLYVDSREVSSSRKVLNFLTKF